jgi:hypothetical protein
MYYVYYNKFTNCTQGIVLLLTLLFNTQVEWWWSGGPLFPHDASFHTYYFTAARFFCGGIRPNSLVACSNVKNLWFSLNSFVEVSVVVVLKKDSNASQSEGLTRCNTAFK